MARYSYLAAALTIPSLAMSAALPDTSSIQIIGGEPAKQGEFPYMVSLQTINDGEHFCGGSLINANTVVTAAHCTEDVKNAQIRAGSLFKDSGGIVVNVSSVINDPTYGGDNHDRDYGVWKLAALIPESDTIKFAKLAAVDSDPVAGEAVTTAGWGQYNEGGTERPEQLRRVTVAIVDRGICNKQYSENSPITENMVCAGVPEGGKDSCANDSGGPLVNAAGELVGIVSWGQGCAEKDFPGVYARVGSGRKFIDSHSG